MSYRTISIQLLRPSGAKAKYLQEAQRRYSQSFEDILRQLRPLVEQVPPGQKFTCPRQSLALADAHDAQPFKDALQQDVQGLLGGYLGRKNRRLPAAYPITRTEDADLVKILSNWGNFSAPEIYTNLDKYGTLRPMSFCRYAPNRDFSLLKSENSKRYYVKLYLFNRQQSVVAEPCDDYLWDIVTGQMLRDRHSKRRYLLLPLNLGQWQQRHLADVERGVAKAKNALVYRRGNAWYLALRLEYQDPAPCPPACHLGVARDEQGLCLCKWDGDQRQYWRIPLAAGPLQNNELCALANQICALADRHSAKLVGANLARGVDGAENSALRPGEYQQLLWLLGQRALRRGLPSLTQVSPVGLWQRCPACGQLRRGNLHQNDVFLCISCGHSQPSWQVSAANLAGALDRYQGLKLRVRVTRVAGQVKLDCPALGLRLQLEETPRVAAQFLQQARQLLDQPNLTGRQRSVARKIAQGNQPLEDWFVFEGY